MILILADRSMSRIMSTLGGSDEPGLPPGAEKAADERSARKKNGKTPYQYIIPPT
jgi:hypothetical protein